MKKFDRRRFLYGAGGVAIALPVLEIAYDKQAIAQSGGVPKRILVAFGGVPLGSDAGNNTSPSLNQLGKNFEITRGLRPLLGRDLDSSRFTLLNGSNDPWRFDYDNVKDEFSVISGLKIPWQSNGGGSRSPVFHVSTICPMLSGISNYEDSASSSISSDVKGPTADYLVHQAIGGSRKHLVLRIQDQDPHGYTDHEYGRISGHSGGANKNVQPNPVEVFDQLFGGFEFSGGEPPVPSPTEPESIYLRTQRRKKSVLDLVLDNAKQLKGKLGKADQCRLDKHFEEIWKLEQGISDYITEEEAVINAMNSETGSIANGCSAFPEGQSFSVSSNSGISGYYNENKRASLMIDLIHKAFVCDQSRAVSLLFTYGSCYLDSTRFVTDPSGAGNEVHALTHSGKNPRHQSDVYAWHVQHMARLTSLLKNEIDIDGTSSILDNSVLILVNEAGDGVDPESDDRSHSSENMIALVSGRVGGLKPQGLINLSNNVHPASVFVTAMKACGVNSDLGEISASTAIDELST